MLQVAKYFYYQYLGFLSFISMGKSLDSALGFQKKLGTVNREL